MFSHAEVSALTIVCEHISTFSTIIHFFLAKLVSFLIPLICVFIIYTANKREFDGVHCRLTVFNDCMDDVERFRTK